MLTVEEFLMQTKRAFPRLKERDNVAVTVLCAAGSPELEGRTFFCTTDDISGGGLRFSNHTRIPEGSTLELRVTCSHPLRAFRHIGRVAWVNEVPEDRPYAEGVQFTGTPLATLIAWKDGLAKRMTTAARGEAEVPSPQV
jgi:hypothetical protein